MQFCLEISLAELNFISECGSEVDLPRIFKTKTLILIFNKNKYV